MSSTAGEMEITVCSCRPDAVTSNSPRVLNRDGILLVVAGTRSPDSFTFDITSQRGPVPHPGEVDLTLSSHLSEERALCPTRSARGGS